MKIMFYSQHVLGIGHFFRSMELAGALDRHDVLFVEGGDALEGFVPPSHVTRLLLPPIMMDSEFKSLQTQDRDIHDIRSQRRSLILESFLAFRPDVLITELFPFGRKQFRFELMPLLDLIKDSRTGTKVICSLRDILVEKRDQAEYEEGVLKVLNAHYHHLMVHSDPRIMTLDETFDRVKDIAVPLDYTGFIARKRATGRKRSAEKIIIVSSGGGKVGVELLDASISALKRLPGMNVRLRIFIGPFMENGDREKLTALSSDDSRISMEPFSLDFLDELSHSDLSVSMAGYNTCMDVLSAGVPAFVYPFPQNREQMMRARKFEKLGFFNILNTLDPDVLAGAFAEVLLNERTISPAMSPDLSGAAKAAVVVEKYSP